MVLGMWPAKALAGSCRGKSRVAAIVASTTKIIHGTCERLKIRIPRDCDFRRAQKAIIDAGSGFRLYRLRRIAQRFTENFLQGTPAYRIVWRRQPEIHYPCLLWKNFRLGRLIRVFRLVFAIIADAASATVERLVRRDR